MEVQLTGLRGHRKENPPGTTHQLHTLFQAALTFLRRKRIRGEEREGGKKERGGEGEESVLQRHCLHLC